VVHTYVVTNRGPWRAKRLEVVIDWPYEVENKREHGKWLLYLMETQVQGSGYCETSAEQLNPLQLRVTIEIVQDDVFWIPLILCDVFINALTCHFFGCG